ncbi:MAG: hypothetical protein WC091_14625 [Sulfuricellaceae bacterium]
MHILIAEKDSNGRRILNQLLKMEGYRISVAESGNHAMDLLKEVAPDIVLMNVFQCLHSPDASPTGKITILNGVGPTPVLLVTCSTESGNLGDFMAAKNPHSDAAFDLLPTKVKSGIMDNIQQLCGALRQCRRMSSPETGFNWNRFNKLMNWSPALEIQVTTEAGM